MQGHNTWKPEPLARTVSQIFVSISAGLPFPPLDKLFRKQFEKKKLTCSLKQNFIHFHLGLNEKVYRQLNKIYTNDDTDFFNTNEVNAAVRESNKNIFNPFAWKVIKILVPWWNKSVIQLLKILQGEGDLNKAETSHLVEGLMEYKRLKRL